MRTYFYSAFLFFLFLLFVVLLLFNQARWFLLVLLGLAIVLVYDCCQRRHTLLKNFPIVGHFRYVLEAIRPEIRQYFVASDREELPFNRDTRTAIYRRSKNLRAIQPFGTDTDLYKEGAEWVLHSMKPVVPKEEAAWVIIGGHNQTIPYRASCFNISAMSFGALSKNAIIALNEGAKKGCFYHNTGEGGITTYHQRGGDLVWQIGTGYFGCRDRSGCFNPEIFQEKVVDDAIKMIEIKLSQGAKPGHGGLLPADKVTEEIARIRMITAEQDIVSPAAHSAFDTPIGLLHFVDQLRTMSGGKPVGFKLCVGKRSEFLSICKAMIKTGISPDFISVDGAEGGTGAAPQEFSNFIGFPLNEGLHFVHTALIGCGLRDRIRLIASGKIATGFDIIRALALGADLCSTARPMMMALGCLQSQQCHRNTCPVGVATQNRRLYKNLDIGDKRERVYHFHHNTVKNYLDILGAMGLQLPSAISRTHMIRRISDVKVNSYNTIYRLLEPNCLVEGSVPEAWLRHWNEASAEYF